MDTILFCTLGSLGDVYPYVAIGQELMRRGFTVAIATGIYHKEMIEGHGFKFFRVRPDLDELTTDPQGTLAKKIMDERTGSQYVLEEVIMKNLRDSYADFLVAMDGVDLVITHPITYAAILAARMKDLPWLSTFLAPASVWSAYDPPSMPNAKTLPQMRKLLGLTFSKFVRKMAMNHVYPWSDAYRALQRELGLKVDVSNPFFEGQYSRLGTLALFSEVFAGHQPDWPPASVNTGFPFMEDAVVTDPRLDEFLSAGAPPVVFTLGSSAVMDPGTFYRESINALSGSTMRGILLTGSHPHKQELPALPHNMAAFDYLPHSYIFPRAAAIVHQGGIGTTAQSLRSGLPQLVMPYSHDQFDNAQRVARLGAGRMIERNLYNGKTVARILKNLQTAKFQSSAHSVRQNLRNENGARTAADKIVAILENLPALTRDRTAASFRTFGENSGRDS